MSGPLTGVTVLELIQKGPGAFVTMMLADMGADVIKIETPSGARQSGSGGSARRGDPTEQVANVGNRGKRSIVIDLKQDAGRDLFHCLAEKADIVIEGFRPGVAARLGADYATLQALNPRIIHCSLSGYGQNGPYRDLPGHDINFIGFAGIQDLMGPLDGDPVVPPNLVADFGGAAMHAVSGISMALYAREKTGRGQQVDIAYLDCALSLLSSMRPVRDFVAHGKTPVRGLGALGGSFPYYRLYRTGDGKWLNIGCVEPWLWANMCKALDRPDLADGGPEAKDFTGFMSERQAEVGRELEALFATRDRDAWFALLSAANVCVGKVLTVPEVFDDPQLKHRGMVTSVEHPELGPVAQVGTAIRLSDTPGAPRGFAPFKGEHTDTILAELGLDEAAIATLRQAAVV